MKRLTALFLILCMIFSLSACSMRKDRVEFYYLRANSEYIYGAADGVIAGETRMVPGYTEDLTYLLKLYLEGPLREEHESPLPLDTALIGHATTGDVLNITLNGDFDRMTDMEFTLATACIARTCFDITPVRQVSILYTSMIKDPRTVTITRDALMLVDDTEMTLPTQAQ